MALDIHKVRQLSSQAQRDVDDAKRKVESVINSFRNLGSGFTADRLYSREYVQLDQATKDAVRAIEKIKDAVREIDRKA